MFLFVMQGYSKGGHITCKQCCDGGWKKVCTLCIDFIYENKSSSTEGSDTIYHLWHASTVLKSVQWVNILERTSEEQMLVCEQMSIFKMYHV